MKRMIAETNPQQADFYLLLDSRVKPTWSKASVRVCVCAGASSMFVLEDFHQTSILSLIYLWIFCCFPFFFHHHTHREFWSFLISTSTHTFTLMYTENNPKRCVYKCLHSRANWSKLSHNDSQWGSAAGHRRCLKHLDFHPELHSSLLHCSCMGQRTCKVQTLTWDLTPAAVKRNNRISFICILPGFLFLSETPPLVDNQETEKRL